MEDRELERLAKQLGARAEQQIDVDRVAKQVVSRLRNEPQDTGPRVLRMGKRTTRRVLQIAAMLAVVLTGGLVVQNIRVTPTVASEFAVPLALDDLSELELTDVLDSLELVGPVRHVGRGGIDDLNASELAELLAMMEG